MRPGVLAASDGERQPEDEPEQPPPRRHPHADKRSPPQQHRRPRADPEPEKQGDSGPEEAPEEKARPPTRPDLPLSRPLPLAQRDICWRHGKGAEDLQTAAGAGGGLRPCNYSFL